MINGIINIYKEKGYTSHDVVAKLRGITGQKKIGHTGTLDPDAEGVLPVCLGKATKVCDLLTDKDKIYETTLLLGVSTDTQDISGTMIQEKSTERLTEEQVKIETARCLGCGASVVDPNRCLGCGICTTKCEFDAIKLHRDRPEASKMVVAEDKMKHILPYFAGNVAKLAVKKIPKEVKEYEKKYTEFREAIGKDTDKH